MLTSKALALLASSFRFADAWLFFLPKDCELPNQPSPSIEAGADGVVGMSTARNTPRLKLTDGSWHMITVTTMPYGGKVLSSFLYTCVCNRLELPPMD